jgi:hypothetical protein
MGPDKRRMGAGGYRRAAGIARYIGLVTDESPATREPDQPDRPRQQRRARKIAMSKPDLDAFLTEQRTCRVATASDLGPHLTPLWYVWDGTALWLTSIVSSQRWTDLGRDPRVAVLVDAGDDYAELRGVELRGRVEIVGEVPRTGLPEARLDEPERLFARKYAKSDAMHHDGRHAWLRLVPDKVTSWDFRLLSPAQTTPAQTTQAQTTQAQTTQAQTKTIS